MEQSQDATVIVRDIVGGEYLVSSLDGDKVFRVIEKNLLEGKRVKVVFPAVQLLTSAFLNAAIGQLYGIFSEEIVQKRLDIIGLSKEDQNLVERVVETAKTYFLDREEFERAIRESGASYDVAG